MNRKILLINVYYDYPIVTEGIFSGVNKIWQPLSLAFSSALLKAEGIDVKLLDANALRIRPEATGGHALGYDMVFVSTSSYERWECPHLNIQSVIETCKSVRKSNPEALIILEGSHGTVRPLEMLELTGADGAVVGEPELTVRDAATAADWHDVDGVAYLADGKLKVNPIRKMVELDDLPVPDFSQLPMNNYFFEMLGANFAVLETSRGCPYNCFYCLKVMFGRYRAKSLENVKREILYCVRELKVKRINFLDLEFTINRPLVEGLCDWLIEENMNIEWGCQTRLDKVDEQLLRKMKKAGCRIIMYGVESASPRIIDMIGKNITLNDYKTGIEATKRAGITSVCFFMFGFPSETDDERESTVKFALDANPDYASFFVCRPYPGTKCHVQAGEAAHGLFPFGIGSEEELVRLNSFCDESFRRFYYRPHFIVRRLVGGRLGLLVNQIKIFAHKSGLKCPNT